MVGEGAGLRSHLLAGTVRHRRQRHTLYDFTHRVWYLALDLDEVEAVDRRLPMLGVERRNLLELRDADHLEAGHGPLGDAIRERARSLGLGDQAMHITLVTYPRVLGYVFNPVSFYLCHQRLDDGSERLPLVVAEVHNTHGERQLYEFVRDDLDGDAPVFRAAQHKRMYVSPFIAAEARYELRVWEDERRLAISIHEYEGDERALFAAVDLERVPLTSWNVLRLLARDPIVPLKTSALIFWHAARLRLRGVPWMRYRRPKRASH